MSVLKQPTRLRKALLTATIVLVALLVPLAAFAIPGSGDFIPLSSPSGRDITQLYNTIAKICLVIMIIVEGTLAISILKFRRRSDDERPKQIHGNLKLELTWTLAALAVQVFIGFMTINVMFKVETIPDTTITVEAIGYQWNWEFRYPDQGGLVSDDLVVPAHTNVKLEVTSRDVIHSLFIPELGTKIDAVPGRFNYFWFNADGPINSANASVRRTQTPPKSDWVTTRADWWRYFTLDFTPTDQQMFYRKPTAPNAKLEEQVQYLSASKNPENDPYLKYDAREYRGMCAELCGRGHYNMYFRVVAMTNRSFQQWLKDKKSGNVGPAKVDGKALFQKNCSPCHGMDGQGTPGTYPPLVNSPYTNDAAKKDEHIKFILGGRKGSINVLGTTYNGVMPPFNGKLNDAQAAALATYERTTWGNKGGKVTAKEVAKVRASLGMPPFPAGGAKPVPTNELTAVGERVYKACASCHGADGKGSDAAPSLVHNPTVMGDIKKSVTILDKGLDTDRWSGAQPPMGASMTDRQIAGVLTYIRTSFGNKASAVQPHEVGRIRKGQQ